MIRSPVRKLKQGWKAFWVALKADQLDYLEVALEAAGLKPVLAPPTETQDKFRVRVTDWKGARYLIHTGPKGGDARRVYENTEQQVGYGKAYRDPRVLGRRIPAQHADCEEGIEMSLKVTAGDGTATPTSSTVTLDGT